MIHLKIILYGILAFIERNPKFCVIMLLIGIFAVLVMVEVLAVSSVKSFCIAWS